MKPIEIYASTHAVSVAAAQMSEHIEKLSQAGLVGADEAQRRLAVIEGIRASTSADVGLNMADPELENAGKAERKQLAIERKWKQAEAETEQDKPTGGNSKS